METTDHVREAIKNRRSRRKFTADAVSDDELAEIIIAGSWAPSGLNNQPWRFVTVQDRGVLNGLAGLTRYSHILKGCAAAIAVFLDREAMYNEVKDCQAAGACIQNMLLAAGEIGLGAVWLGEILNRADDVNQLLELPERYWLMAVIALGRPAAEDNPQSDRKPIDELIIKKI